MTSCADKPVLSGVLVDLRPFTADDVEAMAKILVDHDVQRLTGSVTSSAALGHAMPIEQLREWYSTRSSMTDRLDLAVVDRSSGSVVGEVVLNEWNSDARSVNFRILLGPAGRDQGFGTEATRLVLTYAFDALGLHRVALEVFAFNPRARRVYERAGFVHEGTRRAALRFDDDWIDALDFAILDREWCAQRAAGAAVHDRGSTPTTTDR